MSLPITLNFDLSGKSALVTGASSGIGMACAVALARAGAHVTLAARRQEKLQQLANQMTQDNLRCDILPLNVADIEACEAAIAGCQAFDILVNSAGLARHSSALLTQSDDYDAVMNINVRGAYFLTRAVAQQLMHAGKGGSLINISSQMGHVGGIDRAVYCASKFAVEGFTKAMAIEWGQQNIRVNTVCPTFIRTELTAATFADSGKRAWIEDKIKLPQIGEVEDVAAAVVYLASDAARMVTGTALMVDGGWTCE